MGPTPFPDASDHAALRDRLTPEQYRVTQEQGTEPAFSGALWDCHDDGTYHCVVCDASLYTSDTKYESGSGWPSFWAPMDDAAVTTTTDSSHGMVRTEVTCTRCGAHLGHVFDDGPRPSGLRYCMNSASLRLDRDSTMSGPGVDGGDGDVSTDA